MRLLATILLAGCIEQMEDPDGDGWLGRWDCAPDDGSRHPAAIESCNGRDDDCDGTVDEDEARDAPSWYRDEDGDGSGDPLRSHVACEAPKGFVSNGLDCDDGQARLHPDVRWFADKDADGFGAGEPVIACTPPGEDGQIWVRRARDCDDEDPLRHPEAPETCNEQDDDCDDDIDEGVTTAFHADADEDGFGDPGAPIQACEAPAGAVADATDCDDGDTAVNPAAARICNDGIDNACDEDRGLDPGGLACQLPLELADQRLLGPVALVEAGGALASAGDFDGDGTPDLLVGGLGWTAPGGGAATGAAWLIPGTALDGSTEDLDTVGIRIEGASPGDRFGQAVAGPGDMDGDGLPEVVVSALTRDAIRQTEGEVYILSGATLVGKAAGDSLELSQAVSFIGSYTADWLGYEVTPAGDLNGDGLMDLLMGATGYNNGSDGVAGALLVAYGDEALAGGSVARLGVDLPGAVLLGPAGARLAVGQAMAGGVDVNGDGMDDLVVGTWKYEGDRGAAALHLGPPIAQGELLSDADALFTGPVDDGMFGWTVGAMGDNDGDGYGDLVVAAPAAGTAGRYAGLIFILPGSTAPAALDLSTATLPRVEGDLALEWAGYGLAAGGDANGDGFPDLLVGSQLDGSEIRGQAWLFHGPIEGTRGTTEADVHVVGTDIYSSTATVLSFLGPWEGGGDALVIGAPLLDSMVDGEVRVDTGGVYLVDSIGR